MKVKSLKSIMALGNYRIDWGNMNYFEEVEFYLSALDSYSHRVGTFVGEQKKLAAERSADLMKVDDPNIDWFDEHESFQVAHHLHDILFDSCITATMSFIERKLLFLCLELEKNQHIKLNDLSGKGIRRFRTYLSKVCGVNCDEAKEAWEELLAFNELRNIVVHSHVNRIVKKTQNSLRILLSSLQGVALEETQDGYRFHITSHHIVRELLRVGRIVLDNAFIEYTRV